MKTPILIASRISFLLAGIAAARAQPSDWEKAAGGHQEFEVAAIKPSDNDHFFPPGFPLDNGDAFNDTHGRFVANFPLIVYIRFAYKMGFAPDATTAAFPKWITTDRFSIEAKAANPNVTKDQFRLMVRQLLIDRFKLALHFETQERPVFTATLARPGKRGPNLRPHAEGPSCDQAPPAGTFPPRCDIVALTITSGKARSGSRNSTMPQIASALSTMDRSVDRPVIDHTGLEGRYDFFLEWGGGSPDPADLSGTTFLQALRDQLGIKLEAAKAPLQIPIIDHIERPADN